MKELQNLCADNLVEFLGNGAMPFTTKLFQVLESGSVLKINNEHQNMEPSQPPLTDEIHSVNNSSPKQDIFLTSSEQSSDSEDHDISDDDDDDRNHKHRRRGEAEPNSMQNDAQDHFVRKPNKKRTKLYDSVQECNPTSERNNTSKFNTYRSKVTPHAGMRARYIQPARFDLSTTVGRPIGRGRGRGPWNSHDTLASHANLFVGTSTQNSSWGGFGFIPGIANGLIDPLNPLGLQAALNPPLNIGMPRQHCRDFEERGFCLRGDMCPMEHGLNRIVVEDVQSLSQFNLPVSIPSSHALGVQNASGALPPTSSQLPSLKSASNKSIKSGTMCDSPKFKSKLKSNPSISTGNDADVYDPDQPLWNNDVPSTSASLLKHSSPNAEDETSYDVNATPLNTNSSTWGHIGSKNKSDAVKMEEQKQSLKGTCNQIEGTIKIKRGSNASAFNANKDGKALFSKALRTLYVFGIPQKSNRKDALMEHFQKFGVVIDIYIPSNSEIAFVQFSKREEAESALKSPDAIMGNRFIKLSWANRDRIVDNGPGYGQNKFIQPLVTRLNTVNGGKGIASNSTHKNSLPAFITTPDVSAPAKDLISNTLNKTPAPPQKKNDSLELLEELRKKQESLAKKREDFKRQLEEYAKHAVVNKKGDLSGQAVKKQKLGAGGVSVNAADQVIEKKSENASKDASASNGSKTNPHTSQRPLIYQTSYSPILAPNRYKLDNRSTSFEIFPLPADITNVAAIKDHFSCYGVITSVVLGDQETVENKNLDNCENRSAFITFANRQSAEKAYLKGKLWDGHEINFKWVNATQNLSSSPGAQENSSLPAMTSQSDEAKKTNLQYGQDSDANCLPELVIKSTKDNPQSSPVKSSCEARPFGSSTQLMIEDDTMDSSAL